MQNWFYENKAKEKMRWLLKEARMAEEPLRGSEEEIIASDDALVIAGGFHAIAESIGEVARAILILAKSQAGDIEPEDEPRRYMDGTRIE